MRSISSTMKVGKYNLAKLNMRLLIIGVGSGGIKESVDGREIWISA